MGGIMALFEAAIYNKEVRECVEKNASHDTLEDVWADLNFIEVEARDEEAARKMMERRYPPSRGYEITQILETG